MAFQFAGRYGPEIFEDELRVLLKAKPVTVYDKGTNNLASLYTDRTKAAAGPNPFTTDARGNGYFFADPGEYDLDYAGWRLPITVDMDPIEAQGDGPPTGPAAGDLDGFYPNPTIRALSVTTGKLADGAVTAAKVGPDIATQAELDTFVAQKGAADGIATLGPDSKIPSSQIPLLSINETFTVNDEAEMLALVAQRGDVAIRLDTDETFILSTDSPGTLADWKQIVTPGNVLSVNGQTGAVVIPTDAAAGTGSLRTLGAGATQAAPGNDARLSDQRTPLDLSVTGDKFGATLARQHVVLDAAGRAALTAPELRIGDLCYESSTNRTWVRRATSWSYVGGGTNPYSFHEYRGTAHTALPSGTFTVIGFNTEVYDYEGDYSYITGRFYPSVAGLYAWAASVGVQVNNNPQRWAMSLFVNTLESRRVVDKTIRGGSTGDDWVLNGSGDVPLAVGDYCTIRVFNGGPNVTNIVHGDYATWFSMHLISEF